MKTLLSAKLSEGKILIVDNDDLIERKTKYVAEMLSNFTEKERFLYVTGHKSEAFTIASRNIPNLTYESFDNVNATEILLHDKVMFNLDGILNMMRYLHEKTVLMHKPKPVKFTAPLLTEMKRAKDIKEGKVPEEKVLLSYIASL